MDALDYDSLSKAGGLLPVVAQDALTGEVRMVAFASPEAVQRTLESGKATFFSRSRGELWEKGKTSGNGLDVSAVLVDCDADCLLYLVTPRGPTCHTGAASCFFRRARVVDGAVAFTDEEVPETTFLVRLASIIEGRKQSTAASSYTKSLLDGGPARIGAKLREEADELARAIDDESDDRVVSEAADVVFHLMVGLASRDVEWSAVLEELERRTQRSGHEEKRSRT